MNNLVQQSTCQIHWSWVEVQRELLEKQKEGVKETGFSWMTCRPLNCKQRTSFSSLCVGMAALNSPPLSHEHHLVKVETFLEGVVAEAASQQMLRPL